MQENFENNFTNEKCFLISSQNFLIIRNIQPVDTANVK